MYLTRWRLGAKVALGEMEIRTASSIDPHVNPDMAQAQDGHRP